MSTIVESMNRIQVARDKRAQTAQSAERFLKWHPAPEPNPPCACGQEFRPHLKAVRIAKGGIRQVVVTAKVKRQIHEMAFTYKGQTGMCVLTEGERRRLLADAGAPGR